MAAAITTSSTTIEGQVLEVAREMQVAESALEDVNNVAIDIDVEGLVATISVTIPLVLSGTGGSVSFAADTYLPDA
ncbi:hypothetical protein [cf. Phormidesmis sp. LEGE 11477]|uniref:hypothetical protein n=1 Tax=cf. Phormidesmis sp. LEGE 11477 TaxID=1828680 RepID=UPI00187FD904|nr:hypothetical protein [cf. Phormidesmis sp. LEGE 11477]MBE9064145.1 hypothetical protein [cf. Phormidesmis sp. LEGE 11477]